MNESEDKSGEIDKYKKQLEEVEGRLSKNKNIKNDLEILKDIYSDKGLRKFVLKQYVPLFNKKINEYLEQMEIDLNIEFDSNFNQIENKRRRNSRKYEKTSQGEHARINFAILLTFIYISEMKYNSRNNFLIVDEAFSNGLDTPGKENIIELLTNKIGKKIICISHDDSIQSFFNKQIEIYKEKGFSKIKEIKG